MTVQEFSHEFDVLYNNITNGVAPGVNEYEKSVFLTKSQYQFVQDILIGNTTTGDGVDNSTKTRLELRPLYVHREDITFGQDGPIDYPTDILHVLNMSLYVGSAFDSTYDMSEVPVIPISYDDKYKVLNNPFYKTKHRAYILQTNNNKQNIYYKGNLCQWGSYSLTLDYIRYPKPIILENLEEGFTIDGKSEKQTSELPEFTHFEILKRAIQMALVANGVADS